MEYRALVRKLHVSFTREEFDTKRSACTEWRVSDGQRYSMSLSVDDFDSAYAVCPKTSKPVLDIEDLTFKPYFMRNVSEEDASQIPSLLSEHGNQVAASTFAQLSPANDVLRLGARRAKQNIREHVLYARSLFVQQRGRCGVSGVPLTLDVSSPWRLTLVGNKLVAFVFGEEVSRWSDEYWYRCNGVDPEVARAAWKLAVPDQDPLSVAVPTHPLQREIEELKHKVARLELEKRELLAEPRGLVNMKDAEAFVLKRYGRPMCLLESHTRKSIASVFLALSYLDRDQECDVVDVQSTLGTLAFRKDWRPRFSPYEYEDAIAARKEKYRFRSHAPKEPLSSFDKHCEAHVVYKKKSS